MEPTTEAPILLDPAVWGTALALLALLVLSALFSGSEANTVAGRVTHAAQAIPNEGQALSFHGFRFEVLERENNRLTRLRIRKPA